MLIALIFRGVAFEFRFKALPNHRGFWDKAFIVGSGCATFMQGIVVGAVINGFPVSERTFVGGAFDWLTPFNLFCGIGLMCAYALLGSTWLIMKTSHHLQNKMYRITRPLLLALLVIIAIISIWTPLSHGDIAERWFSWPNIAFLLPVPVLTLVCAGVIWRGTRHGDHYLPFMMTLLLVFLGFSGLGISIWPHIIPPSIDIWQAAAPPQSLGFMLVGALFIIPIILVYTFWSYYVFRGKISADEGYH